MALLTALAYGAVASAALVVGSLGGAYWPPPDRAVGALLALSSGALITALAFELFEPAYTAGGPALASTGLFVGAATFAVVKWGLRRGLGEADQGPALLASVTLDGVPENLALGIVLVGGQAGGALAVLVAITLSNLPEAIDGAQDMTDHGLAPTGAVIAWTIAGIVLAAAVVVGNTVAAPLGQRGIAVAEAFAGGAVLASVAVEILPDAYEEGGPLVALATAAGFVVTFLVR